MLELMLLSTCKSSYSHGSNKWDTSEHPLRQGCDLRIRYLSAKSQTSQLIFLLCFWWLMSFELFQWQDHACWWLGNHFSCALMSKQACSWEFELNHAIWDGALCWSVIKPIMLAWAKHTINYTVSHLNCRYKQGLTHRLPIMVSRNTSSDKAVIKGDQNCLRRHSG